MPSAPCIHDHTQICPNFFEVVDLKGQLRSGMAERVLNAARHTSTELGCPDKLAEVNASAVSHAAVSARMNRLSGMRMPIVSLVGLSSGLSAELLLKHSVTGPGSSSSRSSCDTVTVAYFARSLVSATQMAIGLAPSRPLIA